VTDARRIPDAIAEILALPRSAEEPPLAQVITHLRAAPWLLVLDNLEHLVEEGALLVRHLLEQVPSLVCLTTSRQRLGIAGEQEFALLPLPTPRSGVQAFRRSGVQGRQRQPDSDSVGPERLNAERLNALLRFPSIQLFVDRARAVRSDFALTEGNGAAVAALCDRLEGLPLAIELAAARVGVLAPEEMLAQLQSRFAFLVSRQRDLPLRHQSLRAAIDSSYRLLPPDLQRCFARLSVFQGGWTLEAAAAVASGSQVVRYSGIQEAGADTLHPEHLNTRTPEHLNTTLDALQQLRECSLVLAEEGPEGTRYRLLETLREYAWGLLAASDELAVARKAHYNWYLQFARQVAASGVRSERLETEIENVRAALAWCQEEAATDPDGPAAAAGLRLVATTWWLWHPRGRFAEGLHWLESTLERGRHLPPGVRAPALSQAAHLCTALGDRDRSRSFLQAARGEYEAVLAIARREGDPRAVAETALSLSEVVFTLDDLDAGERFGAEARQIFEELQEPFGLANALQWLAEAALRRRDRESARSLLEERLAIYWKLGAPGLLVHALGGLGHLERDEGNYARAGALYRESLLLRRELDLLLALAQSLEDLAGLASRQQQPERALRLLGAEEAFCETLGARPPVAILAEYERALAVSRAALGEAAFAAAWAQGRAMSLGQAVDYALGEE
jgi:non-specific serine/threonine protein kinase